jgi:hypothetical protein
MTQPWHYICESSQTCVYTLLKKRYKKTPNFTNSCSFFQVIPLCLNLQQFIALLFFCYHVFSGCLPIASAQLLHLGPTRPCQEPVGHRPGCETTHHRPRQLPVGQPRASAHRQQLGLPLHQLHYQPGPHLCQVTPVGLHHRLVWRPHPVSGSFRHKKTQKR